MRSLMTAALLALLTSTTPALSYAQHAPNLSGTWVLQVDKSDFGMMPAPTSRTDVIDHQDPKLTIKRTVVAGGAETVGNLVFGVDGKPYKNMMGTSELTSTLKWDGPVLVVTTLTSTPQGEVTLTDRFSLSADGKTLTQDRSISVQGQELTQKLVLVKQP
jgi:hypothetical protein